MSDIGTAVAFLRAGHRVQRQGWNGKGMYLFLYNPGPEPYEYMFKDGLILEACCQPYVMMKTADNTMVPWLCSQSDLLATDWNIAI